MTGSSPPASPRAQVPAAPGPASPGVRGLPGGAVVMPRRGLQLPQHLSFEGWVSVGRHLSDIYTSSAWCLGDWLVYGEAAYRSRYREAAEQTSLDYQTLRNYAWVAKRFSLSRRRDSLSFGHHAEVAALPEAEQDFWLRKAEELRWPVKRLRHEVRASQAERRSPGGAATLPGSSLSGHPRVLARGDSTAERVERILVNRGVLHVMEQEIAAGTRGRRHLHPHTMQICYILAGNAVVEVGSISVTASAGQAIEIAPGDAHQIRNEADATVHLLIISSSPPHNDREDVVDG